MAAVIELSSDEEDISENVSVVPVIPIAGVHDSTNKKQTREEFFGAVRISGLPESKPSPFLKPPPGLDRLQSHPQNFVNGATNGGPAEGMARKNNDTIWEEVSPSPRLSTWGEPLPPEPSLLSPPDQGLQEKGVYTTSDYDHVQTSQASRDVPKRDPGPSVWRGKASVPSSPTPTTAVSSEGSGLCRNFWRAGDYEAKPTGVRKIQGAMDHVRVHPKFLHSNATSHKWALGAVAELLDNAVDEVQNGATFVSIDKIVNPRDNAPALLVQDDGGGMTPDCMRQCMSLGYSRKNTNTTIGQYGNGFKTSTMRLGADVVVFSRCGQGSVITQSIGLLSYTFLRKTGHEDVVVPMIDYEVSRKDGERPRKMVRSSVEDWVSNLTSITQWSPFASEAELLAQFEDLGWHGTKVIVYNLWHNDDSVLELDFDTDEQDIQLRGGMKQDKSRPVQQQLTQQHIANRYHHSLRIYASILYLQMPPGFQVILRGKPVEHHIIASDLKFPEQIIYKPQIGNSKDSNKEASVITIIGFTKEAPLINVHGFNVYHKNRLIMPFWKVWQDNSSRGRGVVGVLEANFVEPAHDKQDFERTAVFLRLETRLKQMTVEYWNLHCHLIGYQPNTKAGKARKQASTPPIEYPAPIASVTPASALPSTPGTSGLVPPGRPKTAATRADGTSLPDGVTPPKTCGPSTPPLPADDGLMSTSGDPEAGPRVKTEPFDGVYDHLKRVNNDNIVQGSKRQRVSSNGQESLVIVRDTGGGGRDLAVQQSDNDSVMIELIEENAQLRSRCVEYELVVKELGSKVEDLQNELLQANLKIAKLRDDQEDSVLNRVLERSEEKKVVGDSRAVTGIIKSSMGLPLVEPISLASVGFSVKVEE